MTYQRYEDADLAKVEQEIALEEQYGKPSHRRQWAVALAVTVLGVLALAVILWPRRSVVVARARFEMPRRVTPFTVLGLLKEIQANNGLDSAGKTDLRSSIDRIERYYFVGDGAIEPDLQAIAESWLRRVT
jgi:hypothetical protein